VSRTAGPVAPELEFDAASARAALGGRRIGPHMPLAPGLRHAVERAVRIGATAMQVFADNPTAWRRRTEPPDGIEEFRRSLEERDIGPLAVHAPYLINLATPDPVVLGRSIDTLVGELAMASHYGARFVNIHVGSHRGAGTDAGTATAGEALARVLERGEESAGPSIALEVSAGQGDSVGVTLVELAAIIERAERHGADPARLVVCLDTAHLWGAGFDLDHVDGIERLVAEVDALLGPGRLAMIHLNDARTAKGSHLDRHEHIGAGRIGAAALRRLLTHPRLTSVPMYLETPGMDTGWDGANLDRVRRLIAGAELPELPPEASLVRSERL
jgi:deoxyribonuclease-4